MDDYFAKLDAAMKNSLDESVFELICPDEKSNNNKKIENQSDYDSNEIFTEEEEDDDDSMSIPTQDDSEDMDEDDECDEDLIKIQEITKDDDSNKVPVIFFDSSTQFTSSSSSSIHKQKGSKSDWKQFMSSDISKINDNKKKSTSKPLTKEEKEQELQDKRNDKELMDLLHSSNILEEYDKSEFGAKNRHYLHDTYEIKKIKAPKNIQYGMLKKAKEKMDKRIQEAKDLGLYTSNTKNMFKDERTKEKERQKRKESMHSRGLSGTIGKYKNGVLHVSKKHIEQIENGDKKRKGSVGNRAFNSLGGDHRKRAAPGKSGKTKNKKRRK